ncbi:MAG: SGNH/GDSL hydrolase family protein [Sedimentisphaerales bacterium]|nr:SGNH/GDSL hydrolase family protein [Sedimentisphaerales bacterium]MBN2841542.1 SGNH/GDSL hydrolase family protein [Sedimentisphaerales bacterium]
MKKVLFSIFTLLFSTCLLSGQEYAKLPADQYFSQFKPVQAPPADKLLLAKGDRLAIIGDSITEQKMYSRIMETYLTVCVPQYEITCRQYGWGGERADGFSKRMANDCLRFNPTLATTCYGMNDHRYETYKEEYGNLYYEHSTTIAKTFKEAGVKFVQGSPGTIGVKPGWSKPDFTPDMMNQSLCEFRNIGIKIAQEQNVTFADVFVPMLVASYEAKAKYNDPDYQISGKDGVHPDWAGHLVMAYAFLKSFGIDGEIGTFTIDLSNGQATASEGHNITAASASESVSESQGQQKVNSEAEITITSQRYPFCATGDVSSFKTIRSGMSLVPFNEQLNRLTLKVTNSRAQNFKVTWGEQSKSYSKEQLEKGINLAADFEVNPFSEAFKAVDDAIANKQAYETRQVKTLFHGDEGNFDMEATVALTERVRNQRAERVRQAFHPVVHTIRIVSE